MVVIPLPQETLPCQTSCLQVQRCIEDLQTLWHDTCKKLQHAANLQAKYANKHRKPLELNEGDQALLSTKNINLASITNTKLKPRWIGPFTVIRKLSPATYTLDLPSHWRIHPTFHISLLKLGH